MSERQAWYGQPYLDELRPDPNTSVRVALFATYSVDVSAVAAMLLALTGRNDDKGSGTIIDFAQAVEGLAGKATILIQRGRIARPVALPKIAGILDQFIVEQSHDEQVRSWHPKIALVSYDSPSLPTTWRLWIGSRNLTRSRDLDIGIMLVGDAKQSKKKSQIPGIGPVAARLAADAGRKDAEALASELASIWWEAPPGYVVRSLLDGLGDTIALPSSPPAGEIRGFTIVSPFLKPDFLRMASKWGPDGTRTLISSMPALIEVARMSGNPLAEFSRVLAYAAPDPAIDQMATLPGSSNASAEDDVEPPPLSLHAKIYAFDMGQECIVRIGSANATGRAWSGRNSEIMIELAAGDEFRRGLKFLADSAAPVNISDIASSPLTDDGTTDALEKSRRYLTAAWTPRLLRDVESFTLDAGIVPVLPDPGHQLWVGQANSDLIAWSPGAKTLAMGSVPLSLQSEFIQVRIAAPAGELSWMQRVEVVPGLEKGRDLAALARHMGVRAFHEWMRTRLNGDAVSSDDTPWDEKPGGGSRARSSAYDRLTLEEILSAWAKDSTAFSRVDRHFGPYVEAILAHDNDLSEADKIDLLELSKIWAMARERLAS